jgi:hypothetical protein
LFKAKIITSPTPGTKVYDFRCDSCEERYLLKSKSTKFGRKLTDSVYGPLKDAIEHDVAPSFFFLRYTREYGRSSTCSPSLRTSSSPPSRR